MTTNTHCSGCRFLCAGLAVLALTVAGCGKEETPAAATPVAEVAPTPAPAPEAAPAIQPDAPPTDEVAAQVQQFDTRMQNRDFEGAADVILRAQLAAQQQQEMLSPQQRIDNHNRMRLLQKQIADAMASGDPNAQRAARLLMQYNASQGR
jgi:hypothetical protein